MIGRLWLYLIVFAAMVAIAPVAAAQNEEAGEGGDTAEEGESDGEETEDSGEEEGDADEGEVEDASAEGDESDEEGTDEEDEDEEDEDEEDDDVGDVSLAPPKTLDLDMGGLEDMDPAEDLSSDGFLAEEEASAQAVEDWTERDLEVLELHGYFRVRPELYHKFYMRNDDALFNRPVEMIRNQNTDPDGYLGNDCREDGGSRKSCKNPTLAGANMRLRVEPIINVSEEVWIKSQIDFLDNVMLGTSPEQYQTYGAGDMIPTSTIMGNNVQTSNGDMISVNRVWGEVMTPLGQIRFGRMADHWGLGMLHNAGNGIDQDFGDTVDRLMFQAKINNWLIAPAFDFPSEGVSMTSAAGRPFDVSQLDDSYQLVGIVAYKHDEEDQRAMLRRGDWVINTGLHFTYRSQVLSFEVSDVATSRSDPTLDDYHFYRRDMWSITPDLWFQLLYDTFHLEIEAALVYGEVGNPEQYLSDFDEARGLTLTQWGGVLQADYGLLSDQLRIGLEFGFASGDKDVEGLNAPTTFDQPNGPGSNTFSAFAFNPAYNTDLILYHHILGSVSQSYYFKPWLRYDFLRSVMGKQLWIRFDVLYSRAVFGGENETTISDNSANLGVELNGQVMYVSADNFHIGLKYGVLFPLGAFKGTVDPDNDPDTANSFTDTDLTIPQTLQVLLGISF